MENTAKWKHFAEVDFSDEKIKAISIDTRDFYGCTSPETVFDKEIKWKNKNNINSEDFVHSEEEIKTLLNRLYKESGGKKKWRMLCLESNSEDTRNWNMKYIRIAKMPNGFVVCNSYLVPISKNNLSAKVNQELLGAY